MLERPSSTTRKSAFHISFPIADTDYSLSCAQVKVVGGGNGTPGPTVEFPGAYKKNDPSFNFSIWNGYKDYPMPGPEVWTGSGSSSSSKVADTTASYQGNVGTCSNNFHVREHARDFSY